MQKRTKKTGSNSILIFLAIIIVLALIYFISAYLKMDKTEEKEKTVEPKTQTEVIVPIEGTWVSNYNGTMLTIKGLTLTMELPGVDESKVIKGKIVLEKNNITFIYESGSCKGVEGHYQYTLNKKGELFFKLIKDNCPSRQELMSASWFKL